MSVSRHPGPRDVAPGMTFADGQLTVLRMELRQDPTQRRTYCWVRCRCGTEFWTLARSLRRGSTTSCGCVHAAQSRAQLLAAWARQKGDVHRAPGQPAPGGGEGENYSSPGA